MSHEEDNDEEAEVSMEEVITPPENWSCVVCTYLNNPSDANCLMCTTSGPPEEERLACTKTYIPKPSSSSKTKNKMNPPPPSTNRKSTPIQKTQENHTPLRSPADGGDHYDDPFPAPSPCSSVNVGGVNRERRNHLDGNNHLSGGVGGGSRDHHGDDNEEQVQLFLKLHYLAAQCLHAIGKDDECCSVLTNAVGGVAGAEAAANHAAEEARRYNADYHLNNSTTLLDKDDDDEEESEGIVGNNVGSGEDDMMFSPSPTLKSTGKNLASSATSSVFSNNIKSKLSEIKENKSMNEDQEDMNHHPHYHRGGGRMMKGVNLRASCCALLGMVLNKKNKSEPAIQWLANALRIDPYCVEAFDYICAHHCLKSDDEERLIEALPWITLQDDWLRAFYETKVAPHKKAFVHAGGTQRNTNKSLHNIDVEPDKSSHPALHELLHGVAHYEEEGGDNQMNNHNGYDNVSIIEPEPNVELLAAKAELLWCNHEVWAAHEMAERAHNLEKLNDAPLLVYLATMVYLKMKPKLFLLSHEMVESYPKKWLTWYAVGCYYLAAGKYDKAQQNFLKATKMDVKSVAAWIGCGHAFAAVDESEQALGMYRSGGRLFVGAHLPLLYMGMEYLKTNNKNLSKSFLMASLNLCQEDPLVFNELGVLHFGGGNYVEAEQHFIKVLSLYHLDEEEKQGGGQGGNSLKPLISVSNYFAQSDYFDESLNFGTILHPSCFTALYNLGQTYRKLRKFNQSLKCLKAALSIEPNNGKLHGAIAFTQHLNGNLEEAISGYHIALSFEPQNILFSGLLSRILVEVADVDYLYPPNIPNNNQMNDHFHHQSEDDNSIDMIPPPPPPPPYCSVAALENEIDFTKQHEAMLNFQSQSNKMETTNNETSIYHDEQEEDGGGDDGSSGGGGAEESWELSALTSPTLFLKHPRSPQRGASSSSAAVDPLTSNTPTTPTTTTTPQTGQHRMMTRSSGKKAQQPSTSFMSESDMDNSNIVGEESYDLDSDNEEVEEDSANDLSVEMDL